MTIGHPKVSGVAAKLKARGNQGPFNPNAKLDPSQVVDQRVPTPMDWVHFEDAPGGTFVEDPNVGARLPSAGNRKWIPLPPQGAPVNVRPPKIPGPGAPIPKPPSPTSGGRVNTPNSKPRKA